MYELHLPYFTQKAWNSAHLPGTGEWSKMVSTLSIRKSVWKFWTTFLEILFSRGNFSLGRKNRAQSIGPKFPENSSTKSNGQNICGTELISKIFDNLQRLSFFRKFGHSGNFLFYWALSLRFVLFKVFSPAILMSQVAQARYMSSSMSVLIWQNVDSGIRA